VCALFRKAGTGACPYGVFSVPLLPWFPKLKVLLGWGGGASLFTRSLALNNLKENSSWTSNEAARSPPPKDQPIISPALYALIPCSRQTIRHAPAPPDRRLAESVAKYVSVDMFTRACAGASTKEVIKNAENQLKGIYKTV